MLASRLIRFLELILVLMLAAAPAASRDVSIYLTVEQGNKLIGGLTEKDFRVYEDGESRPFQLKEPQKPAAIAVLVEYSRSSWLYVNDIVRAMEGFFNEAPEGHWYALATFANEFEIQVDFTKLRGKIAQAFSDLPQPMWSEVNTYDAVYEMLDRMSRMSGRRVLIFIGSGADTFSGHTLEDVQRKAEQANVNVYALGAGSLLRGRYERYLGTGARMNLMQARAFMQMLADKTGGQAWFPRFETAFLDVMKGIMQSLEFQYRLVYQSDIPDDGEFHKLRVEAFQVVDDRRTDFEVRVREGWRM